MFEDKLLLGTPVLLLLATLPYTLFCKCDGAAQGHWQTQGRCQDLEQRGYMARALDVEGGASGPAVLDTTREQATECGIPSRRRATSQITPPEKREGEKQQMQYGTQWTVPMRDTREYRETERDSRYMCQFDHHHLCSAQKLENYKQQIEQDPSTHVY